MNEGILEENCLTEYSAFQPCANAISEISLFLILLLEEATEDRPFIMTLDFCNSRRGVGLDYQWVLLSTLCGTYSKIDWAYDEVVTGTLCS